MFQNKILMITGGTGSFGQTVLKRFLETDVREIRIFSRDEKFAMNRSLNVDLFNSVTGYSAPSWPELIQSMHKFQEALNVSK